MKILLLGKTGQLGWELQRSLACLGEVTALDYPQVDFSKPESLREVVRAAAPDVVINAVAYTAVDRAEQEEDLAQCINAHAPGILAEESCRINAAFIHYSTDYVFDGQKLNPYNEMDVPNPVGAYGRSKLAGEENALAAGGAVLVLRTSWLYSLRRDNFALKVMHWARNHSVLRIVKNQYGSPTWARSLAEMTALLVAQSRGSVDWLKERSGVYHLAGDGSASRFEWAKLILDLDPHPEEWQMKELLPAAAEEFPAPAHRPMNSALDCTKFSSTFGLQLPPWQDALRLMMDIF